MRIINTIVILILCSLLALSGYLSYTAYQNTVQLQAARNHESIVRGFANTMWKMHSYKMLPLFSAHPQDLADDVDVAVFAADVTAYFSNMQVATVNVSTPSQLLVMSFNVSSSAQPMRPGSDLLAQAISNRATASKLVMDGAGNLLVQSVVPIIKDDKLELLVTVASDVTQANQAYIVALTTVIGSGVGAIFLVFLLGYFNVRRAEGLIAKQFEVNASLVAKATMAQEENQQKSQFLANITHELRTPLNAIIGFSDILRNEFVPGPGQSNHVNYISDIHSAGTHLLSLINDILDFSKAEAGKLELEVTEVNAVKMIQNCMRLMQPRAEIAQVRLIESLPKEAVTLITDGKKFKQILLNLLSNSVKFTPPNGTVEIAAWADMQSEAWVFQVRDSGIGIAPKDIPRAMAPFGQIDNALSRKFEGTGLGLPLVKKFVELMGGTFAIESELNKGTTVRFSLPRQAQAREGVVVKHVA
jgi:two-component system cell cycle sensor histidine kinase PleC